MCVVYLMTRGCKAKKENQRLIIEKDNEKIKSLPLKDVDSIVIAEGAHISTPLIEAMLQQKTPISFVDFRGKITGYMNNDSVSWTHSKIQMERFTEHNSQIFLIRKVLKEKIANQRKLLRYYTSQKKNSVIGAYADSIKEIGADINHEDDVDILMGIEGMVAKEYFEAFYDILDLTKWSWHGRTRRPAEDQINALLNYGYAFLEKEVRIAIAGAGLDPRFGFFHSNNGRKDSLVYDLMELFRQPVIDRFVLSIVNRGQVQPHQFIMDNDMGCLLGAEVKRIWIALFESFMEKGYYAFEDMSPRQWIRKRVQEFAEDIFKSEGELV